MLERNCAFVDGGIYVLNLAYALHFNHIGNCILNWSSSIDKDKQIRQILQLPDEEITIAILACGNVPLEVKLTYSLRNEMNTMLKMY